MQTQWTFLPSARFARHGEGHKTPFPWSIGGGANPRPTPSPTHPLPPGVAHGLSQGLPRGDDVFFVSNVFFQIGTLPLLLHAVQRRWTRKCCRVFSCKGVMATYIRSGWDEVNTKAIGPNGNKTYRMEHVSGVVISLQDHPNVSIFAGIAILLVDNSPLPWGMEHTTTRDNQVLYAALTKKSRSIIVLLRIKHTTRNKYHTCAGADRKYAAYFSVFSEVRIFAYFCVFFWQGEVKAKIYRHGQDGGWSGWWSRGLVGSASISSGFIRIVFAGLASQ